jgi:hypothetical protein
MYICVFPCMCCSVQVAALRWVDSQCKDSYKLSVIRIVLNLNGNRSKSLIRRRKKEEEEFSLVCGNGNKICRIFSSRGNLTSVL